jgi:hypothetical protein
MPVVTNAAWTDLGTETEDRAMQPRGGDVYLDDGASPSEGNALLVENHEKAVLPGGVRYQVKAVDQLSVNVAVITYGI